MKIRKPMRLEEKLIDLVEEHGEGKKFTEKMEYILDDYFHTIEKRRKELERVKKSIRIEEKTHEQMMEKIEEVKVIFNSAVFKMNDIMR